MANHINIALLDDPSAFLDNLVESAPKPKPPKNKFQAKIQQQTAPFTGLFKKIGSSNKKSALCNRVSKHCSSKRLPPPRLWTPKERSTANKRLRSAIFKKADNKQEISKIKAAAENAVRHSKTLKRDVQSIEKGNSLESVAFGMLLQAKAVEAIDQVYQKINEEEVPFPEKVKYVCAAVESALIEGEATLANSLPIREAIQAIRNLSQASSSEFGNIPVGRYRAISRMSEIAHQLGLDKRLLSQRTLGERAAELYILLTKQTIEMLTKGTLLVRPKKTANQKITTKMLVRTLNDYINTIPKNGEIIDFSALDTINKKNDFLKRCIRKIPEMLGPNSRGGLVKAIAKRGTCKGCLKALLTAAMRQESKGAATLQKKGIEEIVENLREMARESGELEDVRTTIALLKGYLLTGILKNAGHDAYDPENHLWDKYLCDPDFLSEIKNLPAPTKQQQEILSYRLGKTPSTWWETGEFLAGARFHAKCRALHRSSENNSTQIQRSLLEDQLLLKFRTTSKKS